MLLLSFSVLFQSCSRKTGQGNEDKEVTEKADTVYPYGFCTDSLDMVEGRVRSGETFTALLRGLGMDADQAYRLVLAADSSFDMTKLRAGNAWHAYYDKDTLQEGRPVRYLIYDNDKLNSTIFRCTEPYSVWAFSRPVEIETAYADVTISSSLWNDMVKAGVSPNLILNLSEIYAWTIDFFALQQGDRFRVIYDRKMCDGEVIDIDDVLYAVFEHDGKAFPAIRLDQGGGDKYWSETGESLRKAFLKAPLKFSRISSRFSYHRKHPVTGKVRAHTAVDYAAPTGTPVVSIGDGTVISAGWAGGGGNTVKIRHNSVYTTSYMHLSKYASGIKAGARVRQGDVIGYVGSTGMSTGPHLDFRVWKNGTPVDPLKLDPPKAEPIKPENLPVLDSLVRHYSSMMDSLSVRKTTQTVAGEDVTAD